MPTTHPITAPASSKILCYYHNFSHQMQLVRVVNHHLCSLEKIVFPQQRILFEASLDEQLEVYLTQKGEKVLQEIYSCHQLKTQTQQK